MRVELPEIYWHGDRERIMSLDFIAADSLLVTGGADVHSGIYMRLWKVGYTDNNLTIEHVDDLAGTHERAVNIVRVSPSAEYIASGSDDCCVVIWEKKLKPVWGEETTQVGWGSSRILRGHVKEVHDLCWSEDSKFIASVAMDGNCILFECSSGRILQRIQVSNCHVQGVAWSGEYLATLSSDRTMRVYKKGKKN